MSTESDAIVASTDWLGELCFLFHKPRYFVITAPTMNDALELLRDLSYMRRTGDRTFVSGTNNIGNPLIIGDAEGKGKCLLSIGGEFTHAQQQELLRRIHGRYSYKACSLNPDDFSEPNDKRKAAEERRKTAEAYVAKENKKVAPPAAGVLGRPKPLFQSLSAFVTRIFNRDSEAYTLLKNKDIRSWYDKVTAGYTDPVFMMIIIPTTTQRLAQDLGRFLEPLSFVGTGRDNEIVIKSDTIAPVFFHKLDPQKWVLCLCGGFTREVHKEIFDAITSRKYVAYAVGKDTTKQTTIYP